MRVLALDIATSVGWAVGQDDTHGTIERVDHGTLDLSGFAHDFGQMSACFSLWVADMLTEHAPKLVAMERIGFAGPNNYRLCGLLWDAHRVCSIRGVKRIEYTPQQVKKRATGSHKAKKPEVVAAMRQCGFRPDNDHEADAIALLLLALDRVQQKAAA